MTLKSRVSIAKTGTNSLRSTVPEGIVEFLELTEKDRIEWQMDISKNNERRAIIKKVIVRKNSQG